ncbi:MAG TPA: PilC/PilY family type IV pilus protein [Polyangia bacterium]
MQPRLPRLLVIGVATIFLHGLFASVGSQPTFARVDPLTIIKRQIHKPNMLVVLDTSGSLTGVPGGTFDNSDEVGVDCDNGENCRGGVSQGMCATSNKVCVSDDQCRKSTCSTGAADCVTDSDCQPVPGRCTTGENCFADADCPALDTGRCSSSGSTCSSSRRCSPQLRCLYNGNSCATDNDCATGLCSNNTTTCRSELDCPYAANGGTCAYGTSPAGGCSNASQCSVRPKVCSDNPTKTCSTVNDCGGTCKKKGNACTSNADCRQVSGDSCQFNSTCASPPNSCLLPRLTCTTQHADNRCVDTNTCSLNANACSGSSTNRCLAGAAGDLCNASSSTTGSRMCRIGQTLCTRNADCPVAGDTCGPATSRFVIAKRVIRNVVQANANVLNLGLMTFFQDGYFPYYRVSSSTTETRSAWLKSGTLQARDCYSKRTGLSSVCTVDGVNYVLRGHNNTKYLVKGSPGEDGKYVDADYCGWFCNIPGVGTGVFKGAYYEYQHATGAPTTLTEFSTYRGKSFTEGGVTYRYYDSRPDYYNGGASPPISAVSCGSSCSATCGARWDTQLAPFLTTDDTPENVDAMVTAFNQALEPASYGGLIAWQGTPSGCALENSGAQDRNHSAYHYMRDVKAADALSCRQNFVLFITDGEANGPGDTGCTNAACSASDPIAAGCTCRAVLAAYRMRRDLGVRTFVVGFSVDAAAGPGRIVNDNIAKAGGTDASEDSAAPYAFGAASEQQLNTAIQGAIYQAIKGSYGTAPATASQGGQTGASLQGGTLVIDSRADFPSWKGHLVAYDVTGSMPQLAWDAATALEAMDWKSRRVYTADSSNNLVRVEVDSNGDITNRERLHALGLGASVDEAALIARFMLGDPALNTPAILGAIINSTPIDVASPPDGSLPGAHEFHILHKERASLVYVGSDDGMLHAFYTRATTVNGVTHPAGSEAFAFLPRSMLPVVSALYAQGGQIADPAQHIYGLATSPKVKNVCVANCTSRSATWKTVLVMSQGWGGNEMFALDITNPFAATGTPFSVLWSTKSHAQSSEYERQMGLSVPVPAYTFKRSDSLDDHRIMVASSYPTDTSSSTQGHSLLSIKASTGTILSEVAVPRNNSCAQEYAIVGDISSSRQQVPSDNGAIEGRKELIAGYAGDTWGNLFQYDKNGALAQVANFGCDHPLHFSPTVVQLDQDDPFNPHAGDIYLVQVTNSTTDTATAGLPGSRLIVIKQRMVEGRPTTDTSFGTDGRVVLTAGSSAQMCAVSDVTGETCLRPLAAVARPLGSPLALPKNDGAGFTLISNWYEPAVAGCGKGATYFVMHEIAGASVILRQAIKIADEPVVSPIVAGGRLMVTGSSGPINIGGSVTTNVVNAQAPASMLGDLFRSGGWSEVE